MDWLPPFAVLGIHQGLPESERARHAENYRRTLIALRDNRLDLDQARDSELLNEG
jgi:glutathione-regulated potassium-efflux system ancillary protein KefG